MKFRSVISLLLLGLMVFSMCLPLVSATNSTENLIFRENIFDWIRFKLNDWLNNNTVSVVSVGGGTPLSGVDFTYEDQHYSINRDVFPIFENLSGYVPYTGATANVDLGANNLINNRGQISGEGVAGGLNIIANDNVYLIANGFLGDVLQWNGNTLSMRENGEQFDLGNQTNSREVNNIYLRSGSFPTFYNMHINNN